MEELARVYGRSLFEVAREQDLLDVVREQLGQLADAFSDSRDLTVFFFSPYFSTVEKKQALGRLLEGAEPIVVNFLELLIDNHRMPVLLRVRSEYDRLWDEENRTLPVQVTSAVPLDESTTANLGRTIGDRTGRRVALAANVDPEIIGGVIIRVGNSILDASIRNRLEQLRTQVAQGVS